MAKSKVGRALAARSDMGGRKSGAQMGNKNASRDAKNVGIKKLLKGFAGGKSHPMAADAIEHYKKTGKKRPKSHYTVKARWMG